MSTLIIPEISDPGQVKLIARARKYDQYRKMIEDAVAGRCPFCQIDRTYNNVVIETPRWRAWPSKPPEKNTAQHFLIVPTRHVRRMYELTNEEILDLFDQNLGVLRGVEKLCDRKSQGILIRDGAADLAGTIEHLHIHVMIPDGTGRVESPLYKGADDDNASVTKAIVFEKVRQGATAGDLTADERELVKGRGVPGIE